MYKVKDIERVKSLLLDNGYEFIETDFDRKEIIFRDETGYLYSKNVGHLYSTVKSNGGVYPFCWKNRYLFENIKKYLKIKI